MIAPMARSPSRSSADSMDMAALLFPNCNDLAGRLTAAGLPGQSIREASSRKEDHTMTSLLSVVLAAALPAQSPELRPPVRLEAAGKPIDVDVGHAAPFFADLDGDG